MILLSLSLSLLLRDTAGEAEPLLYSSLLSGPAYCPNGGVCVPHTYCAVHYADHLYSSSSTSCWLAINTPGICCYPTIPTVAKRGLLRRAENPPNSESPVEFDAYSLNHAAFVGLNEVSWTIEFEKELTRRKVYVNKGSSAFNHFALFKSKTRTRKVADDAMVSIAGSQDLQDQFGLNRDQAAFGLNAFSITGTLIADKCPSGGPCEESSPWRASDGSCNNIDNPLWGASNTAFQRLLLPEYKDGVWKGKTLSVTGESLPSARLVSINVVPDVDAPSELDTHHVMQWGQFVDHDITHTPLFRSGSILHNHTMDDRISIFDGT
jgi:peroxidase